MAENDQEKQFDPSPQRLKKALEEGNVFKSQETTAVGMLAVGVGILAAGMPAVFEGLRELMEYIFLDAARSDFDINTLPDLLADLGFRVVVMLAPLFGALIVAAVGLNLGQSGINLTMKPLMPKGDRLSLGKGLKRIFSSQGLFTLLKSLVKIGLMAPIAYRSIKGHLPEIMMLHTHPLESIVETSGGWIVTMISQMLGVLVMVSAADFGYEKFRYKKGLKMSMQELKDESKESEGNPQVKGKRREKARQLARRVRLDHAVLQADVVVTNPTHYAIALRYDPNVDAAPRVLCKGMRKRALAIKALALEHGIPTVEDRPLARALYKSAEEEQSIPEELFPAVAALLAEIYRQQGRTF